MFETCVPSEEGIRFDDDSIVWTEAKSAARLRNDPRIGMRPSTEREASEALPAVVEFLRGSLVRAGTLVTIDTV